MVWRLLRDLDSWRSEMNRWFGDFAGPRRFFRASASGPAVNVYESPEEFLVTAELPGADKEQLDISLTAGVLNIRGAVKDREEKGNLIRAERRPGEFNRVIRLSDEVDPNNVNAAFEDGVLVVRVAKSEGAKPKQIEVKVR
ncbi:MAG: Hsp20/alpha crystallin family protein [Planctomycetota bacterium]